MNQWWSHPWKRIGFLVGLFVLVFGLTFGIIRLFGDQEDAKDTALAFYDAVWIKGNFSEAKKYLIKDQHDKLRDHMNAVPKIRFDAKPVMVGETEENGAKKVYIRRPEAFFILTLKQEDRWMVQDFHLSTTEYEWINFKTDHSEIEDRKSVV